ncbi:MAG: methyl-accepting chemotaxis protein [Planctomycetota bacterium]|nr:methyl-accepting chemotaxis protein [Planctomycetota bacterium]MDA1106518.1 methyl-accepting chemotaxis protein [Planctomycetota bacterium]
MTLTQDHRQRAFHRSLLGKLLLASLAPTIVVMLAVAGVAAWDTYNRTLDDAKDILEWEARSLASWVEADIARNFQVSRSLAASQMEAGGFFGSREATLRLGRAALEAAPQITGIGIGYEPNADGNDASMVPAGAIDEDGRMLAYWFRDWKNGNAIGLKALTGMDSDMWYQLPLENWTKRHDASTILTEPYAYEGKLMVENMTPIIRDGAFVGVIGADRALEDLQVEIDRQAAELDVDIVVVTGRGRVVVASDGTDRTYGVPLRDWRTVQVAETAYGPIWGELSARKVTTEREDPAAGGESFFSVAHIATGNWYLVMSVPSDRILGPIMASTAKTLGVAGLGMVLIAGLVLFAARRVAGRMLVAATSAQCVAQGDLTSVPSGSTEIDETGDLLRALDSMTSDLNRLVGQVREAGLEIGSTSNQLAASSKRQEEVVATFGSSSAEIAVAARQITTTGQELAHEMDAVNERAQASAKGAQEGTQRLDAMEHAMQALNAATVGIADRLATINEKAVNIGSVVVTITKVADQTNLLSVNAAIEAEKAGEYGRGFLVVAREIRRLADQTAQATLDIERMVKEMRGAVSSGVMEMDRFNDQVRRNVEEVKEVGQRVSGIIAAVAENSRSFATVREGMRSQAAGATQICDAMGTLSANARTTADVVSEFGKASEQLRTAVGTLRTAVAAFRLRGD